MWGSGLQKFPHTSGERLELFLHIGVSGLRFHTGQVLAQDEELQQHMSAQLSVAQL